MVERKVPNLTAFSQSLQPQFASEELNFGHPTVSRVKVENEQASIRATIALTSINLKSRQKSDRQLIFCFEFVREAGAWKIWRLASAAEDLAEALVKTGSKPERPALLTAEPELVTAELGLALLAQGRRLFGLRSFDRAKEIYEPASEVARRCGDNNAMAEALFGIGNVHRSQGQYQQALEQYRKSLQIREEIGDKSCIANMLNNIGIIHYSRGAYEQALDPYRKSLQIKEEIGDKTGIAELLNGIADVYRTQGNYTQALLFAERAAELATQIGTPDLLWQPYLTIGKTYFVLNQFSRARQSFDAAITAIENLRTQVAGGAQAKQRFFESRVDPYQAMVELLITQNQPVEALTYAERARARVLLDVFSSGKVNVAKVMRDAEIEQERQLKGQLVSFNTQIFREKQREQPDQNRLKQLEADLKKSRLDFEAFQTNLYAAHPELKVQRSEIRPLSLDDAASLIPDDKTALLDFVVADRNVRQRARRRGDGSVPAKG